MFGPRADGKAKLPAKMQRDYHASVYELLETRLTIDPYR